ncbi:MAG: sensor histidine kinase [Algicola sp.]|nr:sensor histidine kinase [Algicola sp.]
MKKLTILFVMFFAFLGFSQTKEQDSLMVQLAFQNPDTSKVATSIRLIKSLYNAQNYNKALSYILESEKLAEKLGDQKGIAQITYYKALTYTQKQDYINAMDYYHKSKAIYITLKDTLGIANINNNIGLIEIERGHYNTGLQYALSAIEEFEKRNLTNELLLTYSNLAKAYCGVKDFDKAITFYVKSLEIEQQNQAPNEIFTLLRLAELYSQKREHRKAIEYYERSLDLTQNLTDSLKGEILPKLGGEYLQFKDYDKATEHLVEALKINRALNHKNGLLIALNNLGHLNLQRQYLKYAEGQLLEARALTTEVNNKAEQLKNYKFLKALDSTNRNFDRAFVWQRQYYQLKSELAKENQQQPATTIEEVTPEDLFSVGQTNNQTHLQQPNPDTTGEINNINRFKLILYALLAALVIVSTFLVLIYLKRNNRIKYTRKLEEKNKKIELQNEAILEQTKHLEEINKVKDKLFSIISHDLKDSLSSIKGFIDLLKDGAVSSEEFEALIPELSENANNASLLLFNLLNWSKSQMQSLEPNPCLFDIQEVFEEKIQLLEHKLTKKHIRLRDKTLADFIYADRSMVEIIIQNLLTNAIKFSKAGDTITIANHISNGRSVISISDTGVGISKENQEKLFKNSSFTTVGTQNEKGTGLGLTICKELVELNQGKIWVESDLNVGSTFYVELPKSKSENGNNH